MNTSATSSEPLAAAGLLDRVWCELVNQPGRPAMLKKAALPKLAKHLAGDRDFWRDLLDRHNLRSRRLHELDAHTRQHAIGNFWGMLAQTAHELSRSNTKLSDAQRSE